MLFIFKVYFLSVFFHGLGLFTKLIAASYRVSFPKVDTKVA